LVNSVSSLAFARRLFIDRAQSLQQKKRSVLHLLDVVLQKYPEIALRQTSSNLIFNGD